jgi:hypothetical protein
VDVRSRYPHAIIVRPVIVAGVWLAAVLAAIAALPKSGWWAAPAAALIGLAALGTWDLLQTRHTILRLYPILGHVRFLMELIRPEIRQYFIESNTEAAPFDRETRDLVYERAKATGRRAVRHRTRRQRDRLRVPAPFPAGTLRREPRPEGAAGRIGLLAAVRHCHAECFGDELRCAVGEWDRGAARRRGAWWVCHDTGEGGISPYHLRGGGDLIWEIGSGYFGCRDADGRFDAFAFAEKSQCPR